MNEIRTVTKNMRLSQWADVIRDCKASGLTIAAYCREHNISRNAYFYWQREIKKAAIAEAGNLFAEVEPAACALPVQMPQMFAEGHSIAISIGDATINIAGEVSCELLRKVIKAVRNA